MNYKHLGTIMLVDIYQDKDGHYYVGCGPSSKGKLTPFLNKDESIDEFCKQFKALTADPKDLLVAEVEKYLNEMDNEGSSNSNKMRQLLDRIKSQGEK